MRTKLSPWVILAILTLIGLIAAVISSGGLKSLGSSLNLGNQLTDDRIRSIYEQSNPNTEYINFVVTGREDCPVISGDVAQGISQRVLAAVSYESIHRGDRVGNKNEMPIFLLRNGVWELDTIWGFQCPR